MSATATTTQTKALVDRLIDRDIPVISLKNLATEREEIKAQLVKAAEQVGFFVITDHGFGKDEIEAQFARARAFFALPDATKRKYLNPNSLERNTGYDALSQFRPSTGQIDQKETLNLQLCRKDGWPDETDVGAASNESTRAFMYHCHALSMILLEMFEEALGLPRDTFRKAHVPEDPQSLSSLRQLHYLPADETKKEFWRNGPHTDLSTLTLLFQRQDEDGLQICPGREALTDFGVGDLWTPVKAELGPIVCNIGDELMYWSDDKYKSIFHRVVAKKGAQPSRYAMAYFNHAARNAVIESKEQKYPRLTGEQVMRNRMNIEFDKK